MVGHKIAEMIFWRGERAGDALTGLRHALQAENNRCALSRFGTLLHESESPHLKSLSSLSSRLSSPSPFL